MVELFWGGPFAMTFSALGLSAPLLQALTDNRYREPTPVQAAAIPAVLRGCDVWACAQTGSGKTAAFAVPILQRLGEAGARQPRPLRALILVPTRELAAQVGEAIRGYSVHLPQPLKVAAVFGGVSINPQMLALRGGADIVVATPGRLLDLIDHNALRLDQVTMLVLDEADRLFDLGFAAELARITDLLPRQRQNLLFSASFPPAVHSLAAELLRDPVCIEVPETPATAPAITQRAIRVDAARRAQLLRHLLTQCDWRRALVFVATRYATEHVAEKLRRSGILAAALHGELAQSARTAALADFKAERSTVLVATDVAARGIDVVELPVVVNFDLPRSAVDYLHRIGRTGRAGAAGHAISFVTELNAAHFRLIEKRHALDLPREVIAGFEPTMRVAPDVTSPTGGVKGKRKSKKDKLREAQAAAQQDDFDPSASAAG